MNRYPGNDRTLMAQITCNRIQHLWWQVYIYIHSLSPTNWDQCNLFFLHPVQSKYLNTTWINVKGLY